MWTTSPENRPDFSTLVCELELYMSNNNLDRKILPPDVPVEDYMTPLISRV